MDTQAHYLANYRAHRFALSNINLSGMKVLEIGVGHGELTSLILERNPAAVVGFEIESGLCQLKDKRFTLIEQDILTADISGYAGYALISNSPYSLLPFIRQMIDKLGIVNSLLLISPKYLKLFPDYQVIDGLSGATFDPPAKGDHLLIVHGFNGDI